MSEETVEAVLLGGPDGIPGDARTRAVRDRQSTIKIPYLGGYEHFERNHESDAQPAVFEWTMRTLIAE